MSTRRYSTSIIAASALACVLILPSVALAGNPDISPVDSSAISAAPTTSTSSDSSSPSSGSPVDSPTVSSYSNDETKVPPAVDPCAENKDGATKPATCTTTPPTTTSPATGGSGADQTVESEPSEIVKGGGDNPIKEAKVVSGGGDGPELPFTGLPLWYAIYAGLGFLIVGAGLWLRAHTSNE